MVVSVVLGALLGRYLDQKCDTEPWLLLTGSVMGLAVGILHTWHVIARVPRR